MCYTFELSMLFYLHKTQRGVILDQVPQWLSLECKLRAHILLDRTHCSKQSEGKRKLGGKGGSANERGSLTQLVPALWEGS